MSWGLRYAAESGVPDLLDVTRPSEEPRTFVKPDVGNIPGDAFISRAGKLYLKNHRTGLWRIHKDGPVIDSKNIKFIHPTHRSNISDHPVQGWHAYEYDDDIHSGNMSDPVAIVLHRCGNPVCNAAIGKHVEMLRQEHEKIHNEGLEGDVNAWQNAFGQAVELSKKLREYSLPHLTNIDANPENRSFVDQEDENYLTHVNTINSIWGQPLNNNGGKYMVSPEMYQQIHTSSVE